MSKIRYFAYGSNMLSQRLQERCRSARAIGPAFADGYDVVFHKRSLDTSGKATLAKTERPGARVHGVLFELDERERGNLDKAEHRYERIDTFEVTTADRANQLSVATYVAPAAAIDTALIPFDWYLDLVIAGADQHELPDDYIAALRAVRYRVDTDLTRPERLNALGLLVALNTQPLSG